LYAYFWYLYIMFHIKDNQMDFVDCYVERRIRKNTSFKQINTLIDWKEIDKEIVKVSPLQNLQNNKNDNL